MIAAAGVSYATSTKERNVLELIREIPEFRDQVSQQALFESAVESLPVKAVESVCNQGGF